MDLKNDENGILSFTKLIDKGKDLLENGDKKYSESKN